MREDKPTTGWQGNKTILEQNRVIFPFLFPGYFCFVDACVVCIISCGYYQFSSALFYVVVLMNQCYLQCRRVLFLLPFLTHRVYQCHLLDVRPYASSYVFLFSCSFVEVILWSTLRIVPSILQDGVGSPGIYPFGVISAT